MDIPFEDHLAERAIHLKAYGDSDAAVMAKLGIDVDGHLARLDTGQIGRERQRLEELFGEKYPDIVLREDILTLLRGGTVGE